MDGKNDLERAIKLLDEGNYTCAFVCGDKTITSAIRGVKPLLDLYESNQDLSSYCTADKVVGNGAAWLYTLLGVKKLYARVISTAAKTTLEKFAIPFEYGELTDAILNHDKTGFCPVETAVKYCTTQQEALSAIRQQLYKMGIIQ